MTRTGAILSGCSISVLGCVAAMTIWGPTTATLPRMDILQTWAPAAGLTGGPYVATVHAGSVEEEIGMRMPCPEYVNAWRSSDRASVISIGVSHCTSDEAAQDQTSATAYLAKTIPGLTTFGLDIDVVYRFSTNGGPPCSLARDWSQGTNQYTVATVSNSLTAESCTQLNAQVSQQLAKLIGGEPSTYPDRLVKTLRDMVLFALAGFWLILVGGPTIRRYLIREKYSFDATSRLFVDVRPVADMLENVSYMWGACVVIKRLSLLAIAGIVLMAVAEKSVAAGLWALVPLLTLWLARNGAKILADPWFNPGSMAPRAATRRRRLARIAGSALRMFATAIVTTTLATYILGIAFIAVGGQNSNIRRLHPGGASESTPDAVIGYLIGMIYPALLWLQTNGILFLVATVPLAGLAYMLSTFGRRLQAASANEARRLDNRPPILYLRNFGDDRLKIYGSRLSRRGLLGKLSPFRKRSFEETIVGRLGIVGPVIAVSQPGQRLPTLGAAKFSLPHDSWQDSVLQYAKESLWVVVSATPADIKPGLQWELEMLAKSVGHRRIMLILGDLPKKMLLRRWRNFLEACSPFAVYRGLGTASQTAAAQVIVFVEDVGWVGLGASTRDEWTYAAAVRAALDLTELWRTDFNTGAKTSTGPAL